MNVLEIPLILEHEEINAIIEADKCEIVRGKAGLASKAPKATDQGR